MIISAERPNETPSPIAVVRSRSGGLLCVRLDDNGCDGIGVVCSRDADAASVLVGKREVKGENVEGLEEGMIVCSWPEDAELVSDTKIIVYVVADDTSCVLLPIVVVVVVLGTKTDESWLWVSVALGVTIVIVETSVVAGSMEITMGASPPVFVDTCGAIGAFVAEIDV